MEQPKLGSPDIQIAALKIWVHGRQYEASKDYWDGNWLRITAHCAENGGSVRVHGSILHLSELAGFLQQATMLNDTLRGSAELKCIEPNLGAVLTMVGSLGEIEARINITPNQLTQQHSFLCAIDQSFIPRILTAVRNVIEKLPIRGEPEPTG